MFTWRYLADGGQVPAVPLVTVGTLHEDGAVAQTLREHLPADVVQPDATTCKQTDRYSTAGCYDQQTHGERYSTAGRHDLQTQREI